MITVVVLLTLLVAASSAELTLSVSDNGTDVEQCLLGNGSTPCKTLHYCLNGIHKVLSTHQNITILLASNQTISSVVEYSFWNTSVNASVVTVSGVVWPQLMFAACASMTIISAAPHQNGYWVWEGIEVLGSNTPCGIVNESITHRNLLSVSFRNCKMRRNAGLSFYNTLEVFIQENEFIQNLETEILSENDPAGNQ